jgi:rRNA maturation endonuclease Nob1
MKVCWGCTEPYEDSLEKCPYCGEPWARPEVKPEVKKEIAKTFVDKVVSVIKKGK